MYDLSSSIKKISRKVSLGAKYLKEFSSRSTFQGYSIQIFGSIGF